MTKKKMVFLVFAIFICGLALLLGPLFPLFPWRLVDVETLRLNSPDGRVDVVQIERDAGAMTVAEFLVYIVPSNAQPSKDDQEVFAARRVSDLSSTWESNGRLLIKYKRADIYHFRNYLHPLSNDTNYEIRIQEMQN